jgi:hypothetical protein
MTSQTKSEPENRTRFITDLEIPSKDNNIYKFQLSQEHL